MWKCVLAPTNVLLSLNADINWIQKILVNYLHTWDTSLRHMRRRGPGLIGRWTMISQKHLI